MESAINGESHAATAETAPSAEAREWPAPTTFEEFWPFYLGEHRDPLSRRLHFIGTSLAIGCVATSVATFNPWPLAAAPVCGYGFAWAGHFLVEKNRPATFTYPLWSLRGDFKMLGMALRGKLDDELVRLYGATAPGPNAPQLART